MINALFILEIQILPASGWPLELHDSELGFPFASCWVIPPMWGSNPRGFQVKKAATLSDFVGKKMWLLF